jgi:acyl-ACP thioesterase
MGAEVDDTVADTWKEEFMIRSYEVDLHGKVFLPVLLSFMQEAASNHVDSLKVGFSHLEAMNRFWVLSRIRIEIERYPTWGERVRLLTWHAGQDRLFGLREFRATDDQREVVVSAISAWLMLDRITHRPIKPSELYSKLNIPLGHSYNMKRLKKLSGAAGMDGETQHRVRYTDLDVNDHMNNARYVEWVLNGYAREQIQNHEVSRCEMNFLAECGHGEDIVICTEKRDDGSFLHNLVKLNEGAEVCRVLLAWRAITPQT